MLRHLVAATHARLLSVQSHALAWTLRAQRDNLVGGGELLTVREVGLLYADPVTGEVFPSLHLNLGLSLALTTFQILDLLGVLQERLSLISLLRWHAPDHYRIVLLMAAIHSVCS